MAIQTIEILRNYMTCEDEAVRNKYYNLLDSFYHKSEGKILHSITEDAQAITLSFTDGNTATANTSVVIPKLPNSQQISYISGLQDALNNKVDKVPGQRLTEQNYSLAEKQKLAGLANYVKPNSEAISYIDGLQDALDDKVGVEAGKGLSTNDFTNALKLKLDAIDIDVEPLDTNVIKFTSEGLYGSAAVPRTGDFTQDLTDAKPRKLQKIYWDGLTEPGKPLTWKKSGETELFFDAASQGLVNAIIAEWASDNRQIYWITQEEL